MECKASNSNHSTVNFIGIAILALSYQTGSFWIAIGSIVMIGSACSFGECNLGVFESISTTLYGCVVLGTGLAGVGVPCSR